MSWSDKLNEIQTAEHKQFKGVRTYIDPETGEVFVMAPAGTHKVVNVKQSQAFKELKEREQLKGGRNTDFTFTSMGDIHEVYSVLSTAQCGYLLLLQCYAAYGDGALIHPDKSFMTTNDMMKKLQLTKKRSTFYDFFDTCIDNGIIIENENGSYSINQKYHFRGSTDNLFVIRSYTTKIKQIYKEVKAVDLGLIYRMLPFVHYSTNALCANPTEQNPDLVRWFNRKELAQAIGVSDGEISRRLPKMTFGDEYVIAKVTIGGKTKYMFNPWVFYRDSKEPDPTNRAIFNTKKG